MPASRTPPHVARPRLEYATGADSAAYAEAVTRGFHGEFVPEHAELELRVAEWDRNFGFKVDDHWIATCGAYSRTLTVPGGQVPVAAVSVVTVAPAYRRRGLLRQMMTHQLESLSQGGTEAVALLWASESLIYGRFGYGHATPRLRIAGQTRSTEFLPAVDLGAGSVDEVTREEFVTMATELHATLLPERPGALDRTPGWWDVGLYDPAAWRQGSGPIRFALHFSAAGTPDGYASFRVKAGQSDADKEVIVGDLDATDPAAYAALWRYLLDLDLVRTFVRSNAPVDEPLRSLVSDQRGITTELHDATYVRLVDLPSALEARAYASAVEVTLEVRDALLPANDGRFRLRAGPDGASVTITDTQPDLSLATRELAACYLGGTSLDALHRAGLVVEHSPGAVHALAVALDWPVKPFTPDFF